jgi:hypothetical protein
MAILAFVAGPGFLEIRTRSNAGPAGCDEGSL